MALLLPSLTITTAISPALTTTPQSFSSNGARNLTVEFIFTYGSGGTSVDAYVQTSFDGATWIDIINFHPTTASLSNIYNLTSLTPKTTAVVPTDGTLSANTAVDGILGSSLRVKYKSAGTYAGSSTLAIYASTSRLQY